MKEKERNQDRIKKKYINGKKERKKERKKDREEIRMKIGEEGKEVINT